MFYMKEQTIRVFLVTSAALVLSGCASSPEASEPVRECISTRGHINRWGKTTEKYTKEDYDFLLAFQTDGYEKMSVEDFNRKVLNWEDEEAYHSTEEILLRIFHSLPQDDKNVKFIFGTLGNTWNECEKKHFNTCEREKAPWHDGSIQCETYGDVFGDSVLLTGGYADFSFDYILNSGTSLTVGQRDDLLESIGIKLEAYMKEQPAEVFKEEKAMKKTLSAQLEKLLKSMDGEVVWGGNIDIDYWRDAPYEGIQNDFDNSGETSTMESLPLNENTYTRKQYDLVMEKLKPENYEQMSVSEFNRTIYRMFSEDTKEDEGTVEAYEMVMAFLPESDENWTYLHDTVQRALEEYDTRILEAATGKKNDFCYRTEIHIPLMEDVYGDFMEVGDIEGAYEFTYRMMDADKLTVGDRDKFIKSVNVQVKESAQAEAKKGTVDETKFKKLLEAAGKAASSGYIEFTGCSLDYFEVYR